MLEASASGAPIEETLTDAPPLHASGYAQVNDVERMARLVVVPAMCWIARLTIPLRSTMWPCVHSVHKSKWVAEHVVNAAVQHGLKAKVFRLGTVFDCSSSFCFVQRFC